MNQPEQITTDEEKNETTPKYPAQSFPPTIKRKPLPTATTTSTSTTTTPSHPPPAYNPHIQTNKPPSLPSRLYTRYLLLPRPLRILLPLVLTLLILTTGLSAGLTHRKKSNLPLPTTTGGPYTGSLTYYAPSLGACGLTSTPDDAIVSISHVLFDAASTSSNPNANPLCGKKIRASRDGASRDVTVVDRCVGCQEWDLDVSVSVFADLAEVQLGRVRVEWAWLEDGPASVSGSGS